MVGATFLMRNDSQSTPVPPGHLSKQNIILCWRPRKGAWNDGLSSMKKNEKFVALAWTFDCANQGNSSKIKVLSRDMEKPFLLLLPNIIVRCSV